MLCCKKTKSQSTKKRFTHSDTKETKAAIKKDQKKEKLKRAVLKETRPFGRVKSVVQVLKQAEYHEQHNLPKTFKIGEVHKEIKYYAKAEKLHREKTLFKGEIETYRLFTVCARLCQVIYWPDKDNIKNTVIKLMHDKDIGLNDEYFKRKRSNFHEKESFYLYDEAEMDTATLEKERRKNDLKYCVTVSKSGYMFVAFRGSVTLKNWIKNMTNRFIVTNYLNENAEDYHDGYESDPERDDDPEMVKRISQLSNSIKDDVKDGIKDVSLSNVADRIKNIGSGRQKLCKTKNSVQVHAGVYDMARDGRAKIIEIIEENKKIHGKDFLKTIIFTGHSLGGALASVSYSWFKSHKEYNHINMEVITFGKLKVGDIKYKERFQFLAGNSLNSEGNPTQKNPSQVTNFGRFIFKEDLVPHLPCKLTKVMTGITEVLFGLEEDEKKTEENLDEEKMYKKHVQNLGEKMGGEHIIFDGFFQNFSHIYQYLHETNASLILTKYEGSQDGRTDDTDDTSWFRPITKLYKARRKRRNIKNRYLTEGEKLKIRFGTAEKSSPRLNFGKGLADHAMMNYLNVLMEELEPKTVGCRENVIFNKINEEMKRLGMELNA